MIKGPLATTVKRPQAARLMTILLWTVRRRTSVMIMRIRQMLPTRAIARMMDIRVTWTIADDVIAPVVPSSMVVGAVIDGKDEEECDIVWREGCSH